MSRHAVLLFAFVIAGCSKQSIGNVDLVAPSGCKLESASGNGQITCGGRARLSWLVNPSEGAGAIDHDESIIHEALGSKMNSEKIGCKLGGIVGECRIITLAGTATIALLGYVRERGTEYFIECAYDGDERVP